MNIMPSDLKEFKKYVAYLLANPEVLKALTERYFHNVQHTDIPMLQFFSHLPVEEFRTLTNQSIESFLHQVLEGKALEAAIQSVENWKAGRLPAGIPKEKIEINDIIRVYGLRKMLFLDFLPVYTSDITVFASITKELERFHNHLEEYAFQVYVEIQQEQLFKEKELIASLINNSINGVVSFDTDLRVTEWNSVMEKWNNLKKSDVLGKKIFDLFPQFEHTEEGQAMMAVLKGEHVYISERPFAKRKGYYEADIIPLYNKQGNITGGVSIIHETTHRREAQEKLRRAYKKLEKKEAGLREAQAIARVGSWVWHVEKNKLSWSAEMKRILGYEQKKIQPDLTLYFSHVHPEDKEKLKSIVDKALQDHQPFSFEHKIIRTDGEERWLLVSGKVTENPLRMTGTSRDITERKAREKELHELHYFLKQITDSVPGIIFIYDIIQKVNTYTNQEVYELLGYTPEEVKETGSELMKMIVHPDDINMVLERDSEYKNLGAEEFIDMQIRVKHKNGSWRWLRSKSKVFKYNEQGEPWLVLGISEDVTEMKEAQEKIIRARDYYHQVLEDFPALIWQADTDSKCFYLNKGWLDFTGRSLEKEKGEGWWKGVHSQDRKTCYQTYVHAFSTRKVFTMEYRLKRRDGQYRSILNFGKPMYGLDGEFTGFLNACFDIQERKDAERLLHEKNQELTAALEELTVAEEQLKEVNEKLERRVEERTCELAASEEEVRQTLDKMIELNDELASRENFLNSIIDQSPLSTWISDAEGTQVRVNQACSDLFGIPDPALGIGKYNILKDEVLMNTSFYQDIVAVFREGKVARFELEYDLSKVQHVSVPMGKSLSLIGTIFPIKNAEGKVTNAVIQHENVTEKRKAELALRQSEEQLRLITDALPILISYIDLERRYRFTNKTYQDWFGQSKEAIEGRHIAEVVGEKSYENIKNYIDEALSGKTVHYEVKQEFQLLGTKYLSVDYIPDIIEGKVKGFYAMIYDISERRLTEQTLENLYEEARMRNKELKRINTDLDNFIYTASHDLKSPVANLEGLLNIMHKGVRQKARDKETSETKVLQMMEISISKLKKTIEDLVEITKVQKEIEQQAAEKVSFWQLTEDIKTDLQPLIEESNAEIIETYKVQEINYPKSNLRSIIYNLLSNALKYRAPDRRAIINITTSKRKDRIILSVRDNGLGMNEVQQKKLFTMFRRMHTHVEGTGIGLYTIKRIIENSGGSIKVYSEINKGTEFQVSFNAKVL